MPWVYWETQDIQQEFDISIWLSLKRGYSTKQAYARAKFQTMDYKQTQLKEHFRKRCNECGRDYWIGVYQCTNCGSGEFTRYQIQDYPLHDPWISKHGDPADVALGRIELEQFREFIKPHCTGKYDWYIFEAALNGLGLRRIAKTFGVDDAHIGVRFRRLKQFYKDFSEGREIHNVNKTKNMAKKTFIYRKGKNPGIMPTRVLVRGGNPDDYCETDRDVPEVLLKEGS